MVISARKHVRENILTVGNDICTPVLTWNPDPVFLFYSYASEIVSRNFLFCFCEFLSFFFFFFNWGLDSEPHAC
jgi:hypothetical protein